MQSLQGYRDVSLRSVVELCVHSFPGSDIVLFDVLFVISLVEELSAGLSRIFEEAALSTHARISLRCQWMTTSLLGVVVITTVAMKAQRINSKRCLVVEIF